jgi:hypothetical protein
MKYNKMVSYAPTPHSSTFFCVQKCFRIFFMGLNVLWQASEGFLSIFFFKSQADGDSLSRDGD